jgi:hypothetical protein
MKSILIAATAVALGGAAAPVETITLHPGESITLRIDNGAPFVEARSPAAPMKKFEIYALWRAETEDVPPGVKVAPPGFIVQGEGPPPPPAPSDQRVRITMRLVPGVNSGLRDNTALFISDGYGSALRYHAVMTANGNSAATDVCTVAPHLVGLEHWSYPIERLDLSDLRLEQYNGSIECG